MKKFIIFLGILIVGGIFLGMVKDALLKRVLETAASRASGMRLAVGSFKAGIVNPVIRVLDIRLSNPRGYSEKDMLVMPEVYVSYDLAALARGKIHIKDMRIVLDDFVVEKDASGRVNFESLKKELDRRAEVVMAKPAPGQKPDMVIDHLVLRIGRVIFKDGTKAGSLPYVFDINLNEEYYNVTDPKALATLVIMRSLMASGVYRLANISPAEIQDMASRMAEAGLAVAMERGAVMAAAARAEAVSPSVKQAAETVGDALQLLGSDRK